MVEPSGWHCHPVATEERFTQVNFYFLILTQNNRKVRKINAFLDWDLHHGSELLSASRGFDSRWEHSRKLQAMQNGRNSSSFFYSIGRQPAMKKVVKIIVHDVSIQCGKFLRKYFNNV